MTEDLPQMKLYYETGRLVSERSERGAAAAAAGHLQGAYPDNAGFSPRNLRRMRAFYCMCKNNPELMTAAMAINWTQNVVIMEADLTDDARAWYIQAVRQFEWSKLELMRQVKAGAHLNLTLDLEESVCYTENPVNAGEVSACGETKDITSAVKDRKAPSGGKSRTQEVDDAATFA